MQTEPNNDELVYRDSQKKIEKVQAIQSEMEEVQARQPQEEVIDIEKEESKQKKFNEVISKEEIKDTTNREEIME